MSKTVSALGGASFTGIADIEELGLRGMITLRGDLSASKLKKAVTGVAGVDMPGQRGCACVDDRGIAWMSPDELLVMVPYEEVAASLKTMETALKGTHHLLADVSDARAVFSVKGAKAREVLAKLAPVDLHPDAFQPGEMRRTRLAQVPAAFWMRDAESFELICFRSVAPYVFALLTNAAQPGAEVGLFEG